MSDSKLSDRELLILLVGVCESTLSSADRQRLNNSLRNDPAARQLYREYLYVDSQLYWHQTREIEAFPISNDQHTPTTQIAPFVSLADGDPVSSQSEIECKIVPTHPRMPITAWPRLRQPRRWIGWAASLFLVGYFGTIAWFLIWDGFRILDEHKQVVLRQANVSAALLTYADDAHWKTDAAGNALEKRILAVRSGLAKLAFSQGAEVIIGGPAEFEVRSTNGGFLHWGKCAAHVPPKAVGFEIETHCARVVDLGTDFRLAADIAGTKLAVLTGKTNVYGLNAIGDKKNISPARCLSSGQAVAVIPKLDGTTTIMEMKYDPEWLAEVAPESLPATVVAYQSSNGATGNRTDFPGAVGLDFDVREPIEVYSLGAFDHLGDGLHPTTLPIVELWSRDTHGTPNDTRDDVGGKVLASQDFTAADSGHLKLGHRFKELPTPLYLPAGSYSIVTRGLVATNPFLVLDATKDQVDFDSAPNWIGLNNDVRGNDFAWRAPNPSSRKAGEVGGTLARVRLDSYFADTALTKKFTLDDTIEGSGTFRLADIHTKRTGPDGAIGFFIGHFSQASDSSERIGMEFKVLEGHAQVRARYLFPCQRTMQWDSAESEYTSIDAGELHSFRYIYDPHADAHGKFVVHIDELPALEAVLTNGGRASDALFDAFGIGSSTELNRDDDPSAKIQAFISSVSYSGRDTSAQAGFGDSDGKIVHMGSRLGDGRSDEFPKQCQPRPVRVVAGSFEYHSQNVNMSTNESGAR